MRPEAIGAVASIDLKRDEAGIIEFAARRGIPFETFDAAGLEAAAGDFSASAFVKKTTGVDNVCERAAVAAAGGRLLARRHASQGVTMALAMRDMTIDFTGFAEDGA